MKQLRLASLAAEIFVKHRAVLRTMEPETLGENFICNILYGILFHIFDEGAVVSRYAEFRMTRPQIHV